MKAFAWISAVVEKIMVLAMGVAFISAAIVILLTLTDIVLRNGDKLFELFTGERFGWSIVGLVDISQLFTMLAASLSIAVAFYRGTHVSVDLITTKLSSLGLWVSIILSTALNLSFIFGCFWAGWQAMQLDLGALTSSSTIAIPYIAFWVPMLAGFALSFVGIVFRIFKLPCLIESSDKMEHEALDHV